MSEKGLPVNPAISGLLGKVVPLTVIQGIQFVAQNADEYNELAYPNINAEPF
jgi:hypothetical protein